MDLKGLAELIDENTEFFRRQQASLLEQIKDPKQAEAGNGPILQAQASTMQSAFRRMEQVQSACKAWIESLPDQGDGIDAPPLAGGPIEIDGAWLEEMLMQVEQRFQGIEKGLDLLSTRIDQFGVSQLKPPVGPPIPPADVEHRLEQMRAHRQEPSPEQRWGGGA